MAVELHHINYFSKLAPAAVICMLLKIEKIMEFLNYTLLGVESQLSVSRNTQFGKKNQPHHLHGNTIPSVCFKIPFSTMLQSTLNDTQCQYSRGQIYFQPAFKSKLLNSRNPVWNNAYFSLG